MFGNIRRSLRQDEDAGESGQALIEYALVLMFVALVAVTALQAIGTSILGPLSDAATGVGGA